MDVAATPTAALGNGQFLIGPGYLVDSFTGVSIEDDGAERDANSLVRAATTITVFASTGASGLGHHMTGEVEVVQRVQARVGYEDDVATTTAVAAGWSSKGYELLAAESDGTVAARSRFYIETAFINEAH